MNRTVFSLPAELHFRVKALADRRGISMAALIREKLRETLEGGPALKVAETRALYVVERPGANEEAGEMKRLVISLPESMHHMLQAQGQRQGVSMAAYIRTALEEIVLKERPKPSFGAFASGYTDTARLAGEMKFEPRSWR